MRLLYIDDDRVNVLLFTEICRLAGSAGTVDMAAAGSGAEALELAREAPPDLLVIDLHLPDTDGFALLGALRAQGVAAPAWLCTADDPRPLAESAREAGFAGCWGKPIAVAQVRTVLAPLLR